jgi:hypothetical protein
MFAYDPKRTWQASGGEFINLRRSGAELREIRLILRASRRFAGGAAGADHMDGKASRERRARNGGVRPVCANDLSYLHHRKHVPDLIAKKPVA